MRTRSFFKSRRPLFLRPALLGLLLLSPPWAVAQGPIFVDGAAAAGLAFTHFNGMSGKLYFPEMTGQGAALFDADNDGDLDIYLVQGAMLEPGKAPKDGWFPPTEPGPPRDRLLRNDLAIGANGTPRLRFTDVTAESGIKAVGYGMGVAAGDVDNDGHVDLYVTNFGANQLWRNRGDGTFEDVTQKAGVGDPAWGTSAAFFDFDRDGWLDLYVVNYVAFTVATKVTCYATSSRPDYCGPSAYPPVRDKLYRNRGDGTFEDATRKAGVDAAGPGLGVKAADFDGDGWVDLYVANDGQANFLWLNQQDGTFLDDALLAGVAVNRRGQPEASMGVDAADFDSDGDPDLFMTHLAGETNTLYVNDGTGLFEDRTIETGLAGDSLSYTAFGTGFLDYDNDGRLDLVIANGAVKIQEPLAAKGDRYPLDQPNQLLHNEGRGFLETTAQAGEAFADAEVSRGLALGDIDNDGDTDVLLLNNNGPARLLLNQVGQDRPWLGLRLTGRGRDMLGARVALLRTGQPPLWRRARTDGSYCSSHDPRVLFGLGEGKGKILGLRVEWPDGRREDWKKAPEPGRYTSLRQGTGDLERARQKAGGGR